ncbi:MAG: glycosyltransferase [Oscillospiraceae bacterium]|jgi:glycosyltransferase involved in cell wall biosynthesis|nr:glycosyltransferase [Oscillospiraceae bacterium]
MKLDVVLVTYNHTRFIEEALQSVLNQKTDFDFDIIVADDCSTDDTVEKIRKLEQRTTIPFRYLKSQKNLGITKNYQRAFHASTAEYIAVLEGDDIWTDPHRLQKHVNFLENHLECTMSFNQYLVADYENAKYHIQPSWSCEKGYQFITSRDIARDNLIGNFSTCVYRKAALDTLPEKLFEMTAYDWITNIMVGRNGMIGYLTDVMSVYRIHSGGVWSGQKESEQIRDTLECIRQYNEITDHLFEKEFGEFRSRLKERLILEKPFEIVQSGSFANIKRVLKRVKDFTPPIIVYIFKLLVPEKIWNKLKG